MRISTKGRYGLRTMMELAIHEGEGPVSRAKIAECHDLSAKYMHTLLTALMSSGLVRSHRGNVGGYVLSRKPQEINLLEIVESLEGSIILADCVDPNLSCDKESLCATFEIWKDASECLRKHLANRTLADVVAMHKEKNPGKGPGLGDVGL